ncbi:MAG: rhodanese-like domain-containing protein [Deltaproteobacteria bacterium]|nr:rhodanese-like domain-containing protein [Deltaproteobacteria bacterium]
MFKLLAKSLKEAILILVVIAPLALIVNQFRSDGIPLWPLPESKTTSEVVNNNTGVISIEEAAIKFQEKGTLFLDARAPEDYSAGHVAGALNLPLHQFDQHFLHVVKQLETSRIIITYCDGVDCPQGCDLALTLKEMGFEKVYFLADGLTEWISQGLPAEKGDL